ncbi:TPA: anaerobic ribonucleoside-triphosphate reductase activating protein [Candidatus Woesearchaeota archaeon]|nr:anaerobic ribonucleoside-triphosphate reductase activating protein [Candidatus Woesearchaeota archaeon]
MIIAGLQKTSLVDYPGKICSTIFLAGCNLRCGFCHNPELVIPELVQEHTVPMNPDELVRQIKERQKYIDGVCITGGEPLLNKDIFKLCDELKRLGLLVKVDTNGCHPFALRQLIEFKMVDYVAMDIKGPKEKYREIVEKDINMDRIEESIELLKKGKVEYEFRTTVVKGVHLFADIVKIGEWLKGARQYYLQQFNVKAKYIDPKFEKNIPYTPAELREMQTALKGCFEKVGVRGI